MAATPGAAAGSSIDPASVDISQLDVSDAMMHLAGPDTIYVTDIEYGGVPMSIILKYDGMQGALIYGPYFEDNKFLLDSFELGYAKLRLQGSDTLVISDLLLYGTGVLGRFEYDGVYTLNLANWWQTSGPMTNEMRIAELQAQSDTSELMANIKAAETERDEALADLAAAEAESAEALADLSAAKLETKLAEISDLVENSYERAITAIGADMTSLSDRTDTGIGELVSEQKTTTYEIVKALVEDRQSIELLRQRNKLFIIIASITGAAAIGSALMVLSLLLG